MTTNAEQIALWNGPGGERRAKQPQLIDAQVRLHNERLRESAAVTPGEHVLDIGCGTGQTARQAAQAAAPGNVLGVDLSEAMLAVAQQLSADEGLDNVTFEQRDAQVHRFEPGRFDVAISRFGVMFFDDLVAAFGNVARALRPGGRLVLLTWQSREANEWPLLFRQALTGSTEMPELAATGHPYTLAEPVTVKEILGAAGFTDVSLAGVHQPVFYGPDVDTACGLASSLQANADLLAGMDEAEAARALGRLREVLAAHLTSEGVALDARTWIITARRG
jgi:SAM-dependent methyltransferase